MIPGESSCASGPCSPTIDLILSWANGREWAIEIKRSLAPKLERGFHSDLEPERSFVVYPGDERYRLGPSTEAISLAELCAEVEAPP